MTIIVAIRVPGQGVVMASDSRACGENQIMSDEHVKCSSGLYILYGLSGAPGDLLEKVSGHEPNTWFELRDTILDFDTKEWNLLAADPREIHFLSPDGFHISYKNFAAIGSGAPYALGFLEASGKPKTLAEAEKLARAAVKCSIKHDSGCGGRIRAGSL